MRSGPHRRQGEFFVVLLIAKESRGFYTCWSKSTDSLSYFYPKKLIIQKAVFSLTLILDINNDISHSWAV